MGDHLPKAPVQVACIGTRNKHRRQSLLAHLLAGELDLKIYVESVLFGSSRLQIRKRCRVAGWPWGDRSAEGCERLCRNHPRRNARSKAFPEKGAQRLIFPCLNVACRPVIQQRHAPEMLMRPRDWDGCTERVALSDVRSYFQFKIELLARSKHGICSLRHLDLPVWTQYRSATDHDGRSASVITDGQPLVVGQ